MANVKKRYWTFIGYPESLPENWKDILIETGLPFAVSPLHDKDLNPDGEVKKSHYHFILCFSGPTTYNSVKALTDKLNSPIPKPLESVKGMYRYFSHKDNPEKFQYSDNDITHYNGFDPLQYFDLTKSEVLRIKSELISLIRNLNIYEYSDLISYCQDNDLIEYFDIASNNTIFFQTFIKSFKFSSSK